MNHYQVHDHSTCRIGVFGPCSRDRYISMIDLRSTLPSSWEVPPPRWRRVSQLYCDLAARRSHWSSGRAEEKRCKPSTRRAAFGGA